MYKHLKNLSKIKWLQLIQTFDSHWNSHWSLFSALGSKWRAVVFKEKRVFLDLGVAHGYLLNIKSFWIYGSTYRRRNKNVKFASYLPDTSGIYLFLIICWTRVHFLGSLFAPILHFM